jgi:hypothetical protein
MSLIDVLWFTEVDDELRPVAAFEVENSTKVLAGLNRLSVVPHVFSTKLFIVGKDDSQKKRFEKHLQEPNWKRSAQKFSYRGFDDVEVLFKAAKLLTKANQERHKAMKKWDLEHLI